MATTSSFRPRVVVVGAGFAGLEAARALRRTPVDVTLLDRRNYHLFQPLLYQVATGALSPGEIAWPIRTIFARQRNVTTLMMEVTGVDLERRTVRDGRSALPYDFLVLATGARHAYFGHDDWAAHAPGLKKTVADAQGLRDRLLLAFERAERAGSLEERERQLGVVIVGGGATGVEMAGAVAELAHKALRTEFRRVDTGRARVTLVEAGPRLLPAFPDALARQAHRALERMKVEVRTGLSVTGLDAHGVTVGAERLEAATVVWAAGVQASPAASWLRASSDRAGRAHVSADLTALGRREVFVVGDTAAVSDPQGRPVPGVAPAAKQMGAYAGHVIAARVAGREPPAPFAYRDQGQLATIGRGAAIVALGRLHLSGFVGWLFWSLVHILFLVGTRSRIAVAADWTWSFLTYQRADRLISEGRVADAPTLRGDQP